MAHCMLQAGGFGKLMVAAGARRSDPDGGSTSSHSNTSLCASLAYPSKSRNRGYHTEAFYRMDRLSRSGQLANSRTHPALRIELIFVSTCHVSGLTPFPMKVRVHVVSVLVTFMSETQTMKNQPTPVALLAALKLPLDFADG